MAATTLADICARRNEGEENGVVELLLVHDGPELAGIPKTRNTVSGPLQDWDQPGAGELSNCLIEVLAEPAL